MDPLENYLSSILEIEELELIIQEEKAMFYFAENEQEQLKILNKLDVAKKIKRKYLTILN